MLKTDIFSSNDYFFVLFVGNQSHSYCSLMQRNAFNSDMICVSYKKMLFLIIDIIGSNGYISIECVENPSLTHCSFVLRNTFNAQCVSH